MEGELNYNPALQQQSKHFYYQNIKSSLTLACLQIEHRIYNYIYLLCYNYITNRTDQLKYGYYNIHLLILVWLKYNNIYMYNPFVENKKRVWYSTEQIS